ncbi:hypothetical protein FXO38_35930 [Capsicum annuum]|nr:hypothetical protein FXO38_35930 [Capsicum annuum]
MADPQDVEPSPLPPTPPDPPDPMEITNTSKEPNQESIEGKSSFKSILLNKANSLNGNYLSHHNGKMSQVSEEIDDTIVLREKDKDRIYAPWRFSVIVKLFKKTLAHGYLRTKLLDLWKPSEPLILVDLGNGYYIAKFTNPENMQMALHGGPLFIIGDFLSVRH